MNRELLSVFCSRRRPSRTLSPLALEISGGVPDARFLGLAPTPAQPSIDMDARVLEARMHARCGLMVQSGRVCEAVLLRLSAAAACTDAGASLRASEHHEQAVCIAERFRASHAQGSTDSPSAVRAVQSELFRHLLVHWLRSGPSSSSSGHALVQTPHAQDLDARVLKLMPRDFSVHNWLVTVEQQLAMRAEAQKQQQQEDASSDVQVGSHTTASVASSTACRHVRTHTEPRPSPQFDVSVGQLRVQLERFAEGLAKGEQDRALVV